jgi:hypothetical protein
MGFVNPITRKTNADRIRYITIAALAFVVPIVILSVLLPNKKLGYVRLPS